VAGTAAKQLDQVLAVGDRLLAVPADPRGGRRLEQRRGIELFVIPERVLRGRARTDEQQDRDDVHTPHDSLLRACASRARAACPLEYQAGPADRQRWLPQMTRYLKSRFAIPDRPQQP